MSGRAVRIANFSGALGDYIGAFRDAVRGEPVDFLIGDYLAELTMGRVAASYCERPDPLAIKDYYVDVFAKQLKPELAAVAARGLKVVVNAGAFNPAGLAASIRGLVAAEGLRLKVAYVKGDDLMATMSTRVAEGQFRHLDTGAPIGMIAERVIAANAYLGGWGIALALEEGADIVICGRVSDASLVLGPAAWWHKWRRDEWDKLAGAVAAGHIIECGPQAMGGNFSGFSVLGKPKRIGFPIAEIGEDGSAVITKRSEEEGLVTVDTVTAQLMYEIQGPLYLNPDVILHVDSVRVSQAGADRVLIDGVRGDPAPDTTKVGCFYPNGWRTLLWAYATGLEVSEKIDWLHQQLRSVADELDLDAFRFEPCGRPVPDPRTQAEATVAIRIGAAAQKRSDLSKLIGGFASFGLGGIPGYHGDVSGKPEPRVDYWPGLIRQSDISHQVVLDDGRCLDVPLPPTASAPAQTEPIEALVDIAWSSPADGRYVPLGDLVFARVGDKGANANLGIWCRRPGSWSWLKSSLGSPELSALLNLPEAVTIERYEFENLRGLLFVLKGYFGDSGSGNVGLDQIGKALGEFLRARLILAPVELLD